MTTTSSSRLACTLLLGFGLAGCPTTPAAVDGGLVSDAALASDTGARACTPVGAYTFQSPVSDPSNPAACPTDGTASPISIGADGLPTMTLCTNCSVCDTAPLTLGCTSSVHMSSCGGLPSAYANYDFAFEGASVVIAYEGSASTGEICRYTITGSHS